MSKYADVLQPVKIYTQALGRVYTEKVYKNYCIVSQGGSNIGVGNITQVTQQSYSQYLKATDATSQLEKDLKGYFATNGEYCFILEVGDSGSISDRVKVLEDYILENPNKMFMFLCPSEWYYPEQTFQIIDNTKPALKVSPTSISLVKSSSTTISIETNGIISSAVTSGTEGASKFTWDASTNTLTAKGNAAATTTPEIFTITSTYNGETTSIEVELNVVTTEDSYSGEEAKNYQYVRDLSFLQLTASQSDQNFIITGNKLAPESDEGWKAYEGKSNVFVVYDNSNVEMNGFNLAPTMMGVMGSSFYDISITNPMTPLNNKSLTGIKYSELSYTFGQKLVQAPQNFIGDFAGNTVLFNGLFADGRGFEFKFSNKFMDYNLDLTLNRLLYNGANVASASLPYNQTGIDIINANIKATLVTLKNMKIISAFAAGYDTLTNTMINEDYISCVDFYTYKATYPENYAAGIYGGISFYVLIQGFIKQINLNVTIE